MMSLFKRWQASRQDGRRRQALEALQQEVGVRLNRVIAVHAQTAPDGTLDAPAHLNPGLVQLVATAQQLDATMCLLKMLIATHPDIRWLKRTWDLNFPQMTDRLFDAPAPLGDAALKQVMLDAWKLATQDYTRLIDEAVRQHDDDT